jgi:hypothetical protein
MDRPPWRIVVIVAQLRLDLMKLTKSSSGTGGFIGKPWKVYE